MERYLAGRWKTQPLCDRAGTPSSYCGWHTLVGPRHGPGGSAISSEPCLSSAARKAGAIYRQSSAGRARDQLDVGVYPFSHQMVGMIMGGAPIDDYAPDFWLISQTADSEPTGYITSPWFSGT